MKTLVKLFVILFFASLFGVSNLQAQEGPTSLVDATIFVPEVCPQNGWAWGVHPIYGRSNNGDWNAGYNGIAVATFGWNTLIYGSAMVNFYAQTPEITVSPRYTMDCRGQDTELMEYGTPLFINIYLHPIYYENGIIVEDPTPIE